MQWLRHAGCSGPMGPVVTARRRQPGSVGQVRECTGPAMPQHTYTQRAHNTHSPARLPVPVGRHPGLCLLVTCLRHTTNNADTTNTQHTTQHGHRAHPHTPQTHTTRDTPTREEHSHNRRVPARSGGEPHTTTAGGPQPGVAGNRTRDPQPGVARNAHHHRQRNLARSGGA